MGFTLRATLDLLPPDATVVVAELVPAVVEWNRGPLGPLAGHPLKDQRVDVELGDVAATLRASRAALRRRAARRGQRPGRLHRRRTTPGSTTIAGSRRRERRSRPDGVLAVWSAWDDRKFEQRLRYGGFTVQVERVRGRLKKGGPRHTIFLGHL